MQKSDDGVIARKEFLSRLEVVAPALSDVDLIPVMTHFWFTAPGKKHKQHTLMAFNDRIAISVPFQTEFEGAVPGTLLMNLLKNSEAKNIELILRDDNNLDVKTRGGRFTLTTMDPSAFDFFTMPEPTGQTLPVEGTAFLEGIENCLRSVGHDTSIPDQLGVTLMWADGLLEMFSTNNSTMSYSRIPCKKAPSFKRVTIPTAFCKQMIKLVGKKAEIKLEITPDHALLDAGDSTYLFGRLVETDGRLDFRSVMDHHFPPESYDLLVDMPNLGHMLERATIITDSIYEQGTTQITVYDYEGSKGVVRRMRFTSKSERGEVVDGITVGDKHPDVNTRIEPKLLKIGYADFPNKASKFLVTSGCAVMAKGKDNNMMYLVASRVGD